MQVQLFRTRYCGYCHAAEALLRRHGIEFEIIDVSFDRSSREALIRKAHGRRTVPVIVAGDEVIGGFDELAALAAQGQLRQRLLGPDNDNDADDSDDAATRS